MVNNTAGAARAAPGKREKESRHHIEEVNHDEEIDRTNRPVGGVVQRGGPVEPRMSEEGLAIIAALDTVDARRREDDSDRAAEQSQSNTEDTEDTA